MKTIISLLFACVVGTTFGQYPFNPDVDGDSFIGLVDFMSVLPLYDGPFEVEDTLLTVVFPDLEVQTDGMTAYNLSNAYYYSLPDSVDVLVHPLDLVSNGIGYAPIIFSDTRTKPLLIYGAEDITHHIDEGFFYVTFRSEWGDPYLYPGSGLSAYSMLNDGVIGSTYTISAHVLFKKYGRWYIK